MRGQNASRPIVTKIGGQQGILNLNKHFMTKKTGVTGLGSLIGVDGGMGVEQAFDEYDDRLEEFLGSDLKQYQEAAKLKHNLKIAAEMRKKVIKDKNFLHFYDQKVNQAIKIMDFDTKYQADQERFESIDKMIKDHHSLLKKARDQRGQPYK